MLRLHLLRELDVVLLHLVQDEVVDLRRDRALNAGLRDPALEDGAHGDRQRQRHRPAHGRVALGLVPVVDELRGDLLPPTVRVLHLEGVFHADHVLLPRRVLHLLLEEVGHGVQGAADPLRDTLLRGEGADPREAVQDVAVRGDLQLRRHLLTQPVRGGEAEHLRCELRVRAAAVRHLVHGGETEEGELPHSVAPSRVAVGAPDDRPHLRDTVDVNILDGVTVRIPLKVPHGLHPVLAVVRRRVQIHAGDGLLLPVLQEDGIVPPRQQHPTRAPRQLVPQGVVVRRGRW
mmetsp:Transcript_2195/g.6076  ORF Transcript_2195/g.6076 Transcript_2195/m.6076 type:complete len:289 (+) Transcript_2195:2432-3298(+)